MKINLKQVGERIRTIRGELTLEDFSTIVGISRSMVSKYENGDAWPKVETLGKILEYGKKSSDWLFYGDNNLVAEAESSYADNAGITPEEENLLKILEDEPDIRETIKTMIELPERKRKIYLGKMLEELERMEEEKKG